jgi:peptidyl-prolyl cis-trans isomerase C
MISRATIVGLAVLLMPGCGRNVDSGEREDSPAVATVDGEPVSAALFQRYLEIKSGSPAPIDPALRRHLLDDLIALRAAAATGSRLGDVHVQEDVELARLEVLAKAAATAAHVYEPPAGAELQSAYHDYAATLPANEFHVAHILVSTEALADALIVKLRGGADFAQLARDQSADDSAARGGDLGWIEPGNLPLEFTDAVKVLKPGQISQPLHTKYGWHVIKLLEIRPAAIPPFDEVKAQLAANIQQVRYEQFLKLTVANTKIEKRE